MTADPAYAATTAAGYKSKASTSARDIAALPIDAPKWKQFVQSQTGALAYHDPAWSFMLAECYGFRPFALGLFERGRILAGLPVVEKRENLDEGGDGSSLPFTDTCPPLAVTESASRELAAGLDRFRKHAGVHRLDVHAQLSGPSTFTRAVGFTHTVDLTPGSAFALSRIRPLAGATWDQAFAPRWRDDQARRARARLDEDVLRPPSAHAKTPRDSRSAESVFQALFGE